MRRYIATIAATAALLAGVGVAGAGSAAAAGSVGWCDGMKQIRIGTSTNYIKQPYHKGTGSRDCTLENGSSGVAVNALQLALKYCNYAPNLVADSDFGNLTENALIYAQKRRGVVADGSYGPNTRPALDWPIYQANGLRSDHCYAHST